MRYENLVFYEPGSAERLLELGAFSDDYRTNTTYLDIHFNAGYIFPVKILNGWQPVAKAGIFLRTYFQLYDKSPGIGIVFQKNDTIFSDIVSSQSVEFGYRPDAQFWNKEMELYVGLTKNLHCKFLKNINIGIEVTRTLSGFTKGNYAGGYVNVRSYTLYRDGWQALSADHYNSKDIAIGLKLSAGLWHK